MILKIPKYSISIILLIIPILYFNSCTFEFVKHYSVVLPLVIACMLGWLVFLSNERIGIDIYSMLPMIGYALFMAAAMVFGAHKKIETFTSDFKNILYLLFFMCMFAIYSRPEHRKQRQLIVFVCISDAVISCVYSIYRLIDDPTLSRLLSTGSYHDTTAAARARGVISFGVIYGLVLVCAVLFFLIIHNKSKRGRNICLFSVFAVALVFAQFTLAILFLAVSVAWILYMNKNRSKVKLFYLVLLGIACLFLLPFTLDWVATRNLFGYEVSIRLMELSKFLKGGNMEGTDLFVRLIQYGMSLSALISSYGMGKIAVDSVETGSHSQWLDGLGNYGLLFVWYIVALFMFGKFVIQRMPNKNATYIYKFVFIMYAVMSLLNTSAWAPITMALFVTVPFICMDAIAE